LDFFRNKQAATDVAKNHRALSSIQGQYRAKKIVWPTSRETVMTTITGGDHDVVLGNIFFGIDSLFG